MGTKQVDRAAETQRTYKYREDNLEKYRVYDAQYRKNKYNNHISNNNMQFFTIF